MFMKPFPPHICDSSPEHGKLQYSSSTGDGLPARVLPHPTRRISTLSYQMEARSTLDRRQQKSVRSHRLLGALFSRRRQIKIRRHLQHSCPYSTAARRKPSALHASRHLRGVAKLASKLVAAWSRALTPLTMSLILKSQYINARTLGEEVYSPPTCLSVVGTQTPSRRISEGSLMRSMLVTIVAWASSDSGGQGQQAHEVLHFHFLNRRNLGKKSREGWGTHSSSPRGTAPRAFERAGS